MNATARSLAVGPAPSPRSATTSLEQLQLSFARFAPQEVVERIINSGASTSAEKKTVTVLVADIVGFTALSEGDEVIRRQDQGRFRPRGLSGARLLVMH